jgi:hypothetical protein
VGCSCHVVVVPSSQGPERKRKGQPQANSGLQHSESSPCPRCNCNCAHHCLHASRKCNDTPFQRLLLPCSPLHGSPFSIAGVGARSTGDQYQLSQPPHDANASTSRVGRTAPSPLSKSFLSSHDVVRHHLLQVLCLARIRHRALYDDLTRQTSQAPVLILHPRPAASEHKLTNCLQRLPCINSLCTHSYIPTAGSRSPGMFWRRRGCDINLA